MSNHAACCPDWRCSATAFLTARPKMLS